MSVASNPEGLEGAWAEALERELIRAAIPGASLAVLVEGQLFEGSWGVADLASGAPMRSEHVFHLFSGTKLFTATLVMALVEAGLVSLEGSAAGYLEGLPGIELDPAVQVQHLLCHDAGLSDTLAAFLAVHLPDEAAPSAVEALRPYGLRGRGPGRGARYANVNYAVLGAIAEQVTGLRFEALMRQRVLDPMGCGARFRVEELAPWTTGHDHLLSPMRWLLRPMFGRDRYRALVGDRTGSFVAFRPYELDTAAIGGLCGNARHFLPFLRSFLEPSRHPALSPETARRMLTRWAGGQVGIMSADGAGAGWKLGSEGGRRYLNHEGGGAGFTSELRIYPEHRVGMVLLMNRLSRAASVAAHRVAAAILDTL